MQGKIAEIFESIQGEGIYLGEKQLFVRLFDCNLECKFCDTKLSSFREYQPQEVLDEMKKYAPDFHSVAFTGGEPLLQKDFLKEVLRMSRSSGFKNYLETNGTLPEALKEVIDFLDIVAMDFKLPSSAGQGDFWKAHREFLKISAQKEVFVKVVVTLATREEDLRSAISVIQETNPACVLVLQPEGEEDYTLIREKLEFFRDICRQENIAVCIIPQIHKLLGVK